MAGVTREEHLDWCKQRALAIADAGDHDGAVASMISDLGKWREPLYDQTVLTFLAMDGIMFCKTRDQVKRWTTGFN